MTTSDDAIEVFQDLDLTYDGTKSAVLDVLMEHLQAPWRRAEKFEGDMAKSLPDGQGKHLAFERTASGYLRAAMLVLRSGSEGDSCRVLNIVPADNGGDLGEKGYNDLLNDFVDRVLKPCEADGISMKLTKRQQQITDWTSKEAADALRLFSAAANKSTGASHPMDAERWRDFLIADHRSGRHPSSHNLQRWLVEVEDWPEEEAVDLIIEREKALVLLEHYDTH